MEVCIPSRINPCLVTGSSFRTLLSADIYPLAIPGLFTEMSRPPTYHRLGVQLWLPKLFYEDASSTSIVMPGAQSNTKTLARPYLPIYK
ncbi:hypothetical protein CEXT_203761 [Caerostris extrusa]|uniref:Uncharacterized protein n=1 Tax=Caerostris extrusa TaxID=172846 RepID=A0AAV4PKB0_CAEEX|nr:hypothetical protein CEXT_203761 [Caerostris extrusa]